MRRLIPLTLAALFLAGCCKKYGTDSALCKYQERVVQCGAEIGLSVSQSLFNHVVAAIRGDNPGRAIQLLVDAAGEAAVCAIGSLDIFFASKPQASPAELEQRARDLAFAREWLAAHKLKVAR